MEHANQKAVAAGKAAVDAHTNALGIEGAPHIQVWQLLGSLLEYCAAYNVDFNEQLTDVLNTMEGGEIQVPAWQRAHSQWVPLPVSPVSSAKPEPTNGEVRGWFDVNAYSTKENYEGPDLAAEILDGFHKLDDAKSYADDAKFADFYEVEVVAYGEHAEYEPGETVYWRFNRHF
ncbi:hypothetical protein F6X40_35680 [Paraburkholderia sp. UCT31]|uniref:hypothetical protein n=1 Tax=Paraburkholderia sp. UCT31 TaxID=2615209 RepID=UPI001655EF91|nr:hypothetical protein [Paraburkholderia sp. UCT31]MBC8741892.1 hypothetical protein [Paraburkholderia sp. UCT31]